MLQHFLKNTEQVPDYACRFNSETVVCFGRARTSTLQKESKSEKNEVKARAEELKTDKAYILVGRIAGVFGVKGWLKIHSYTRPIENIAGYDVWYFPSEKGMDKKQLCQCKSHGKGLIASLSGLSDRDEAMMLQGKGIFIHRSQLSELEEGEYYWQELIGLRVLNQNQDELGQVREIIETGANDVLVVEGKTRILIPWVRDVYVKEINPVAGHILVDWPEDGGT